MKKKYLQGENRIKSNDIKKSYINFDFVNISPFQSNMLLRWQRNVHQTNAKKRGEPSQHNTNIRINDGKLGKLGWRFLAIQKYLYKKRIEGNMKRREGKIINEGEQGLWIHKENNLNLDLFELKCASMIIHPFNTFTYKRIGGHLYSKVVVNWEFFSCMKKWWNSVKMSIQCI